MGQGTTKSKKYIFLHSFAHKPAPKRYTKRAN